MLQIQEFNAALFTFKCSKVNVVKKLSRLFNDFFSFLWPEIGRAWKTRFGSRTNFQTEDDDSVTNFLYCLLKYHTASHTTTELYAYHLLPRYRCIPWIPLCRYSQHLHIHRNDQNVFYCPLGYHNQQSADVRSSVKRMSTHSIIYAEDFALLQFFSVCF